jgi:hypothetical protein
VRRRSTRSTVRSSSASRPARQRCGRDVPPTVRHVLSIWGGCPRIAAGHADWTIRPERGSRRNRGRPAHTESVRGPILPWLLVRHGIRMRSADAFLTRAGMDSLPDSETQPADRLGDLYARHVPVTIGFAYLLTGSRVEAEDLVHEAFVRVVGRLRHLRTPDAFDAYLLRTVVNLHTSRLRRLRVERRYVAREGRRSSDAVAPHDIGERDRIWRALDRLPKRHERPSSCGTRRTDPSATRPICSGARSPRSSR